MSYFVTVLNSVTGKWISGRERMAIEMISFMEIGHEIISTAILPYCWMALIQVGQLSVTG